MSCYQIIDLIGLDLYRKLALRKGGDRIYIPASPKTGDELVGIVGLEAAKVISDFFGHGVIHIPKTELLRERNRAIIAMRLAGRSVDECGKAFGVRARTIRGIAQGVDDERQCWGSSARRMRWWLQSGAQQNFNFT